MSDTQEIPIREVPYLQRKLDVERRDDGTILLRNRNPLKAANPHMLWPLKHWAEEAPDRIWLAQRDPVAPETPGWQELTYREGWARVQAVAQGFLELGGDAPVMILSRNTIDHAVLKYGALLSGRTVVPVTPAYALLSQDFARLNHIDQLTEPAVIYVEDGAEYQRGLDGMQLGDRLVIYSRNAPTVATSRSLDAFSAAPGSEVADAFDRLSADRVAKFMMTSGSTGEPKAVINTHGMICANVMMTRSVWDEDRLVEITGGVRVMCNFLPWSHTFGGNAILHSITDGGGTLYIDWGAPTPARMPETIRNLREVSTTQHSTVPAGWAALATELERDDEMAETFFKRLHVMSYGGASMGQDIYERLQAVAVRVTGHRITLSSGYGATETAPTSSNIHWPNDTMGLIGLPLPGNEFKLVPAGEKLELRVKGVNVTPGYYRDEAKTQAAFDEEGYYRLGDAVRFVDPDQPEKGLAFDGRTAEEFKLANGSWVSAGNLRIQVVQAAGGALSDAVICGLDRDDICVLGFIDQGFCERLVGASLPLADLAAHPDVIAAVRSGLQAHNQAHPNATGRIARFILQTTPPRADAGEITEKGYINQSRAQALRADQIEEMYAASISDRVTNL